MTDLNPSSSTLLPECQTTAHYRTTGNCFLSGVHLGFVCTQVHARACTGVYVCARECRYAHTPARICVSAHSKARQSYNLSYHLLSSQFAFEAKSFTDLELTKRVKMACQWTQNVLVPAPPAVTVQVHTATLGHFSHGFQWAGLGASHLLGEHFAD